jgi:bacteriocin biosynthesis cyclodehydratase domain-containing protein
VTAHRGAASPDVVVIVAHHVVEPRRYAPWLRRDIAHLPIVIGDKLVRVGPVVTPGVGPCLHCVELAHADLDAAWAAIATQLAYREPPAEPALAGILAAATVCAVIADGVRKGTSWLGGAMVVIDATTGASELRPLQPHVDCGCRALPGSATAPAGHAGASRPAPSSAPAIDAPA